MSDKKLVTLDQLETFTRSTRGVDFQPVKRREKRAWIKEVLQRFRYCGLRKRDKTTVKKFVLRLTGYSDPQMTRIIRQLSSQVPITPSSLSRRNSFPRTYTPEDVALLLKMDDAHGRLNGHATQEILRREYGIFHHAAYERLSRISVSHLYNLRGTRQYLSHSATFTKTKPTFVPIGERRKPQPCGKPGYLRVDSVHQGDQDKEKGIYHINLVDEVTQWEVVGCVEGISEAFLVPLLEEILASFPFRILGFHSDNGSEYINKQVAAMLLKMQADQTKSRPRRSNDNGLAETKNGAVIRKHFGYAHIPRKHAPKINALYREYFNPYLNYHRPCGYATEKTDAKGRIRRVYDTYKTPYACLKALPEAETYLREGVRMEDLERLSMLRSDTEAAILMREAKEALLTVYFPPKMRQLQV